MNENIQRLFYLPLVGFLLIDICICCFYEGYCVLLQSYYLLLSRLQKIIITAEDWDKKERQTPMLHLLLV